MKIIVTTLCLAALLAATASAQTTVNPTKAEFVASADHNVTVNGTAVVANYQFDTMTSTVTGALAFTVNLGKPTPAAGNVITVTIPQLAALSTGTYVATVAAVGPGGVGKSAPSNPFVRVGTPGVPTALKVTE